MKCFIEKVLSDLSRSILKRAMTDQQTGRANIVDIQKEINVDLSHIEKKVAEIVKSGAGFQLYQGEVISK